MTHGLLSKSSSLFVCATALAVVGSCGSKSSSGSSENVTDLIGTKITTSLTNQLSAAYPVGLSFSSITTVESAEASLADAGTEGVAVATGDTPEGVINAEESAKPPREKAEEMASIIDAKKPDQCRPVLLVRNLTSPDCYAKGVTAGPGITSPVAAKGVGAPNITVPLDLKPIQGTQRGIRGGDAGVIHETQDGNACLADTAGYYVNTTAETVERATGLIASALCAANAKNKGQLPGVSEKVDLTKEVSEVWNLPKTLKVERFTIRRLDAGGEGKSPVFRTVLKVKYRAPKPMPPPGAAAQYAGVAVNLSATYNPFAEARKGPPPPKSEKPNAPGGLIKPDNMEDRTLTVELVNNPDLKKSDTEYKGRLAVFETGRTGNDMEGRPKKQVRGVAIAFKRSADKIKYRFQSADFNTGESAENSPDKFMDLKTGLFNFKKVSEKSGVVSQYLRNDEALAMTANPPPKGGQKRVVDNAVAGSVVMDLATQTGRLAYHWQASLGDKAARSFIVNTTKDADGGISGCGLAGYSGQFGSEAQGKLQGFYCGWAQDSTSNVRLDTTIHPAVQQQCFKQAAAGGKWVLTADQNKINYTVAADCGASTTDAAKYNLVTLNTSSETEKVAQPEVTEAETAVVAPVDSADLAVPAQ